MADPRSLYNFKPVASAESTFVFSRELTDRRPLLQDLPIPVENLSEIIKWAMHFPEATSDDFSENGRFFRDLLEKVEEINERMYANVQEGSIEPDIPTGFFQLTVYRGFQKSKEEINRYFEKQKQHAEAAQRRRDIEAVAEQKAFMRGVGLLEAQEKGLLPPTPPYDVPGAPRSPAPKYIPKKRTPPRPRKLKGGNGSFSVLSAGGCSNVSVESSLTKLLESVGSYDATSELWTVRVDSLSTLFPKALRDRELRVTVEDLSGGEDVVTAEFHLDVPSSIEPDVQIMENK